MKRLIVATLIALAGCQAPPPRSISYFQAHPEDTAAALSACANGDHRGGECGNAREADAALKAAARLKLLRKGFE